MKRTLLAGVAGLSFLAIMAMPAFARAMMIAPAPIAQRVATSDCIVVGKVVSLEDKMVPAKQFPMDKREYQIANVKIANLILGPKGLTNVRVGFFPMPAAPVPGPGGPIRPIRRYPQFSLAKDQEVLLFLNRHPKETFYLGTMYYNVINKTGNANFDKEVTEAKRCARLIADPKTGLTAKNKDDRFLTAAMLVTRYRTMKQPFTGKPKLEPIDAVQSKQILEALADADWATPRPGMWQMTPQNMFFRLGVTPSDGWTQPKDFRQVPEAAKKWLKDNAGTFRIQQYVAEEPKNSK